MNKPRYVHTVKERYSNVTHNIRGNYCGIYNYGAHSRAKEDYNKRVLEHLDKGYEIVKEDNEMGSELYIKQTLLQRADTGDSMLIVMSNDYLL